MTKNSKIAILILTSLIVILTITYTTQRSQTKQLKSQETPATINELSVGEVGDEQYFSTGLAVKKK